MSADDRLSSGRQINPAWVTSPYHIDWIGRGINQPLRADPAVMQHSPITCEAIVHYVYTSKPVVTDRWESVGWAPELIPIEPSRPSMDDVVREAWAGDGAAFRTVGPTSLIQQRRYLRDLNREYSAAVQANNTERASLIQDSMDRVARQILEMNPPPAFNLQDLLEPPMMVDEAILDEAARLGEVPF